MKKISLLVVVALVSVGLCNATRPARAASEILFLSVAKAGQKLDLYNIRADGRGLRKISRQPLGCISASWSSDKKSIVMAIAVKPGDGNHRALWTYNLAIMNARTGAVRNIAIATSPDVGAFNPAFSPSGKEIVFTGIPRHHFLALYEINRDGSHLQQLTHHGNESGGRFSPNGKRIVFSSTRNGRENIFSMNADGTNETQITHRTGDNRFPVFSANGRKIVFYSRDKSHKGNFQIVVMNANGSAQKTLTNGKMNCLYPKFSPNGTRIAFDVSSGHSEQIYVMNADGSHQERITYLNRYCSFPDWR